jgi:hypothetical protein
MSNRKNDVPPPLDMAPTTMDPEKAIPNDLFEKILSDHNNRRTLEAALDLKMPLVPDDPKSFYTTPTPQGARMDDNVHVPYSIVQELPASHIPTQSSSLVIQQPIARQILYKYITINGFDRDWTMQKRRCNYSIDFTRLSTNYKNIASIKFTRLIIPNEVIENRTLMNSSSMPKFVNHHDQKLAYPYLLLQVDEISDLCDGISQQVQKSFAQFIYKTSYKCPNGRGYVIMVPAQDETKVFYPQSLSAIQRLTFSIMKPNGTLFNNNNDDYNIHKIEYELYNGLYIKIVTDKYFDKNEFYMGDSIQMSGYTMNANANANANINTGTSATLQICDIHPRQQPSSVTTDVRAMTEFVNRSQGHEIVQLGEANDNGFYRSFYVLGPCVLDQNVGKLVIEKTLVDSLKEYNLLYPPIHTSGSIINVSLQNVISMTMGVDVADRAILMTRPV